MTQSVEVCDAIDRVCDASAMASNNRNESVTQNNFLSSLPSHEDPSTLFSGLNRADEEILWVLISVAVVAGNTCTNDIGKKKSTRTEVSQKG